MNNQSLYNLENLSEWINRIDLKETSCDVLTEEMIWSQPGPEIWKASRFNGSPVFYPVYRWQNYYSYSPLALLLKKGRLDLNQNILPLVKKVPKNDFLSSSETLDCDIVRVGGPSTYKRKIRSPRDFAKAISDAMIKDIEHIEEKNPGYTNVLLCGGKDSLNMALLPWKNPVIIASGEPNYPLVKQFLTDNDLSYEIIDLDVEPPKPNASEILSNFCRNDLMHCRWEQDHARIAEKYDGKVIFWKGQLGLFMNDEWHTYTDPPNSDWPVIKRACSIWGGRGEYWARRNLKRWGITQQRTFHMNWIRGAMWQGAHMSVSRLMTGALNLSIYHGPEMRKASELVDLHHSVPYDIRPIVGEFLHGKPVIYPETNPRPPESKNRKGYSTLGPFLEALKGIDFPIRADFDIEQYIGEETKEENAQ